MQGVHFLHRKIIPQACRERRNEEGPHSQTPERFPIVSFHPRGPQVRWAGRHASKASRLSSALEQLKAVFPIFLGTKAQGLAMARLHRSLSLDLSKEESKALHRLRNETLDCKIPVRLARMRALFPGNYTPAKSLQASASGSQFTPQNSMKRCEPS